MTTTSTIKRISHTSGMLRSLFVYVDGGSETHTVGVISVSVSVRSALPARLRAARERAGMTREAVAVGVGRSHSSIVGYENGRILPPLDAVERLAELYNVPLTELLRD